MPKLNLRLSGYIGAILFILFLDLQSATAQVRISGMVADQDTKTGLPAVTIINRRTMTGTLSNETGRYYIESMPGDTLEFSMLSYYSKIMVTPAMSASLNIDMVKRVFGLQEVFVRGRNYHRDSLSTREEYGKYFNYKRPGAMDILKTLPANPITALSYLVPSRARKRKENFREQLEYWEKEKFIDYRYSPELIQRLTKLEGEALDTFILKTRPGYQFLQSATEYDLMLYIKEAFSRYQQARKREDVLGN